MNPLYTVKLVYKDNTRKPDNVPFMSSYHLYTGQNYMYMH
jgi:hypothetical protein